MLDPHYIRQAELLLRCLPEIGRQSCFAVKGGTAINLFVRDMPRLSVDIDLSYLPLSSREDATTEITHSMEAVVANLTRKLNGIRVQTGRSQGMVTKLVVSLGDVQVKLEPNYVLRGAVYPAENRGLCPAAQRLFEQFVSARCLSLADLYGGKLCAALDRQHPRDLYDACLLLDNEGLTPEIRRAFVVYLASHDRPMSELLNPRLKDITKVYSAEFAGMTREEILVEPLLQTRERLALLIRAGLDTDEKQFLLSMKQGEPEWDALGIAHIKELPALQWKLKNIRRMDAQKRAASLEKLQNILYG